MSKLCKVCLIEKPLEEFAKKNNGYQYCCKECKRKYNKVDYQKNKQYYVDKARKRDNDLKAMINALKVRCNRCQESHPATLQFHHIDPNIKEFSINEAFKQSRSRKVILDEIRKCEILCANCHAKEHWQQW